ncbi:hypothetical protein RhiTH_009021 [Rhizoctonia solani]
MTQNTRLEALSPSKQARCDSNLGDEIGRRQCTEGTRESLLADLYQWSDSLDDKPVYLMSGIAGTGKTTIAYSLAKLLEDDSRLGASFFCTRAAASCKDASRIIPSIAYQLARYSTAFQSALCLVLDADPDLGSRNMTTQFKRLLREPLLQVKDKIPKHTVVVLDALDECDNLKATRLLFDLIIRSACELPIKFFAASRPESRIQLMSSQVNDIVHISHLHEIESSLVKRDLEVYLHEELACIKPSQQQINQLAELANNLFVYAATAVRYIRSDEAGVYSNERLLTILNETKYTSKKFSEIDELYTTILTSALENKRLEPEEATRTQALLKTATCIQEPVTIETLASLAGLDDSSYAFVALDPLRSVLHVSRHTGLVFVFHASFSDYLFHRERSGRFFCDKVEQHIAMAHICFELMEKQLRFNICELQSSYIFDCAVADLEQRIESNISASLTYSCQHWANHLCLVPISNHLCTVLHEFLTRRLLFWMEVLNLKEYRIFGILSITDVQRWIASSDAFEDLTLFIHDTVVFVLQFFTSTVSLSTPHIYISALPFSSRRLRPWYQNKFTGLIDIWGYIDSQSLVADLILYHPPSCTALSPNGDCVATGSADGFLELWDTRSTTLGHQLTRSLIGRARGLGAVQFSLDQKYIATGTNDGSIWLSHYFDGDVIDTFGSLEGHEDKVWALDFSPDGILLASGSADCTIRIWNFVEQRLVAGPLQRHSGVIRSVKFSPDGTKVASCSDDCSVCIWNTTLGSLILGPLEGHTDAIYSIDFSPDGAFLVSGSSDGSICIWNIACGSVVANQLEPQKGSGGILSVKYSLNGNYVYCGCQGNVIRVWDTVNKVFLSDPPTPEDRRCSIMLTPKGIHILSALYLLTIDANSDVPSRAGSSPCDDRSSTGVCFSSDGDAIISNSSNRRMTYAWDLKTGKLIQGPFQGRLDTTWAVAFPASDTRLALGPNNNTVHIWDQVSGVIVAGPFKGEVSHVFRLQASLDSQPTISAISTTLSLSDDDIPIENHDSTNSAYSRERLSTGRSEFKESTMWLVAISPDGTRVALGGIGNHRNISIWDISLHDMLLGPFIGHSDRVKSVSFSPDGTMLVSGSDDRSIRIWNSAFVSTHSSLLEGHTDGVLTAIFSPNAQQIASGARDYTVRLWNLVDGTHITCRKHKSPV